MEKETRQREGRTSTGSPLPHHRVLSKSDTFAGKKQPPDLGIERFLQIFDQLKPHIIWGLLVVIAIYNYFRTSNVIEFLILMAAAAGSIPLSKAIDLLRGRSMSMGLSPPSEEKELNGQPGEKATEDQDEPA